MCIYQATDVMTYPLLSQMSKFTLSHTLLHSHYSNTVNISTVVILGFWLCQFNTGSLACGLCLLLTMKFFAWLLQFNICSLVRVGDVCGLSLFGCLCAILRWVG